MLGVAGRASGSDVQQPGSASWISFDRRTWRHLFLGIDHFGGRWNERNMEKNTTKAAFLSVFCLVFRIRIRTDLIDQFLSFELA